MICDPRHVLHLALEDRPGAVHAVAEVFSGRGLQLEAFHGHAASLAPDGVASALVVFRAHPERARLIARIVSRLSMVRTVALLAEDDERLRCTCLVAASAATPVPGISLVPLPEGVFLACGSLRAMADWWPHAHILSPLRIELWSVPLGSP